ncbi:WxL domain-containing protein [Companilactobacillus farciminis]|uniref:WxL domain-containing protein n=1 Tax=Companilactobacillus farciminis TaxID=1612 RepID=UPI0034D49E4C
MMKWFKNVVRLLLLISLSLSLSPLTTAQAATAIQVQNDTKSTYNALPGSDSGSTPVAESDTVTSSDSATGDGTTASSNVSVTVLSGILTLEAVPNFNFGSLMANSTGKLKSNTTDTTGFTNGTTAGIDGNDDGLLEVIDSRNMTSDMPGFTLTASMGPLKTIDTDTSADLDAILYLSAIPLLNGDQQNVSNSSKDLSTQAATIDSTKQDAPATVMNLEKGSYNAGIVSAKFNTPDSAKLHVGGTNNGTEQSSKKRNAVITWTLSAKPSVTQ